MSAAPDPARHAWDQAQRTPDLALKRRWLARAHRLAPKNGEVALALATVELQAGEAGRGAALFRAVAERDGVADAWFGLALAAWMEGDQAQARRALAAGLQRGVPNAATVQLADAVAGRQGWCGLTTDGRVVMPAGEAWLDGQRVRAGALPEGWRQATRLEVTGAHGPALGSPISVRMFAGLEGFVEAHEGGLRGWAWHRADPGALPTLEVAGEHGVRRIVLEAVQDGVPDLAPLARPRRLSLDAAACAALGTTLAVRGPDGRHVLGSPLDPGLERRAAADGDPAWRPVWADVEGIAPAAPRKAAGVDVVVPVHGGGDVTLACIEAALAGLPRWARLVVVDDASPDAELGVALDRLAGARRIRLVRLTENRGFPGAVNAGLAQAALAQAALTQAGGRDVVLLNSDTLVPPGWLARLRAAAYADAATGSATPLSNDATIVSYPDPDGGPAPDLEGTVALDAMAQQANAGQVAVLPVGVGFCLYLRRDCLDDVGAFREDLFAQGYGEENDWCLRARHRGWRHVAALDVFVAHVGGASFGGAKAHLARRNGAILERLHPGYDALVQDHLEADPLAPARHRIDALRWAALRPARGGAVLFVTHGRGGGVDQALAVCMRQAERDGLRPLVLRPGPEEAPAGSCRLEQPGQSFPNLVFAMPEAVPSLVALLRGDRVRRVELHHTADHHAALDALPRLLRAEAVSVMHDAARFCGRVALLGPGARYCGEPEVEGCEACVADLGPLHAAGRDMPGLLARSAAELGAATRVVAPSLDAASRLRRHFPRVVAEVSPWEEEAWPVPRAPRVDGLCTVVTPGAIGTEKGYDVLLACARDARARGLALHFAVVGFTHDDIRLLEAGPVSITGRFAREEGPGLVAVAGGTLALIPSVVPETWCFALSLVWSAGLRAAVFDIGAQAERVRRASGGWVLPLGLGASGVNDALLRVARGG